MKETLLFQFLTHLDVGLLTEHPARLHLFILFELSWTIIVKALAHLLKASNFIIVVE